MVSGNSINAIAILPHVPCNSIISMQYYSVFG